MSENIPGAILILEAPLQAVTPWRKVRFQTTLAAIDVPFVSIPLPALVAMDVEFRGLGVGAGGTRATIAGRAQVVTDALAVVFPGTSVANISTPPGAGVSINTVGGNLVMAVQSTAAEVIDWEIEVRISRKP